MPKLTENFTEEEFACPCCGKSNMDPGFMSKLQKLRTAYGKPFSPVHGGGYRCINYNGSATGAHTEGKAIDPNTPKEALFAIIKLAFYYGFTGIGVKQKDGEYQLHLDDAKEIPGIRPRPWFWTY